MLIQISHGSRWFESEVGPPPRRISPIYNIWIYYLRTFFCLERMGFFSIVFAHALAPIFSPCTWRCSRIAACISKTSLSSPDWKQSLFWLREAISRSQGGCLAAPARWITPGCRECILLGSLTTPLIHSTGLYYILAAQNSLHVSEVCGSKKSSLCAMYSEAQTCVCF